MVPLTENASVVWGGREIARAIGRTRKVTYNLLENGNLPGARKIGGRWCLHLPTFLASFEPAE